MPVLRRHKRYNAMDDVGERAVSSSSRRLRRRLYCTNSVGVSLPLAQLNDVADHLLPQNRRRRPIAMRRHCLTSRRQVDAIAMTKSLAS
jgi:hypothetical protein